MQPICAVGFPGVLVSLPDRCDQRHDNSVRRGRTNCGDFRHNGM